MMGRTGADKIVNVPVGTIVWQAEENKRPTPNAQRSTSNEAAERFEIRNSKLETQPLVDLTRDGEEFVLCQGGAGGKGNVHFKSSRNRAPRQFTEGEEGEEGHFLLELRTIADAGLVGYPNAGKSTLLRKISAARPKVAAYPFTTLHPIVGVIEFPGYKRATIADIPGLIEGAHKGLGLGHEFLRHVTRCRILILVIDIAGSEGRNPVTDLQNLRQEIDLYDPALASRPWLVVANKMDLPDSNENLQAVQERFPRVEVIPVSAATGEGMDLLKQTLTAILTSDEGAVPAGISYGQLQNPSETGRNG
jgi:GTP-binding protein